jgi:hypothetical protein
MTAFSEYKPEFNSSHSILLQNRLTAQNAKVELNDEPAREILKLLGAIDRIVLK